MRHNCQIKDENGDVWEPFLDMVLAGYIEYKDFYNGYVITVARQKKFLFWKRWVTCLELLTHCPYCGDKIKEE